MAITLKGLNSSRVVTPKGVVNQVAVKQPTLRLNSLAALAKVEVSEKGFTPKRFSGIVTATSKDGSNLVVRNMYSIRGMQNPVEMKNTVTLVPVTALPNAKYGMKISYEMTKSTSGKNLPTNFRIENDLVAPAAIYDFTQGLTEVRIYTEADLLAIANGVYRTAEFTKMSNNEQKDYIVSQVEKVTGELLLAYSFRNIALYIATAPVTTASTSATTATATNNADTTTTATTDNNVTVTTGLTTVAA